MSKFNNSTNQINDDDDDDDKTSENVASRTNDNTEGLKSAKFDQSPVISPLLLSLLSHTNSEHSSSPTNVIKSPIIKPIDDNHSVVNDPIGIFDANNNQMPASITTKMINFSLTAAAVDDDKINELQSDDITNDDNNRINAIDSNKDALIIVDQSKSKINNNNQWTQSMISDLPSRELQQLNLEQNQLQPVENSELFRYRMAVTVSDKSNAIRDDNRPESNQKPSSNTNQKSKLKQLIKTNQNQPAKILKNKTLKTNPMQKLRKPRTESKLSTKTAKKPCQKLKLSPKPIKTTTTTSGGKQRRSVSPASVPKVEKLPMINEMNNRRKSKLKITNFQITKKQQPIVATVQNEKTIRWTSDKLFQISSSTSASINNYNNQSNQSLKSLRKTSKYYQTPDDYPDY